MKSGTVYYRDIPAGVLIKDDDGYLFRYDDIDKKMGPLPRQIT